MTTHRFPMGLNNPITELPVSKKYSPSTDGKIVYIDPDGKIDGVIRGTNLRGARVTEEYQTLEILKEKISSENTYVFLLTYSQIVIVNMDSIGKITPTIFFIGIFDKEGKYIDSHDHLEMHQYCSFSTRAEALIDTDSSKIHILPLLTREEALASFNNHEDIICIEEDCLPIRLFDEEHLNRRNAVSGTQNSFQCFVRFIMEIAKDKLVGSDENILRLLKESIPQAIEKLNSIQCQTNWIECGEKMMSKTEKLLNVKEGFRKGKPVMYTEYGKQIGKRQLPPNFLKIYYMKIGGKGFLAKVFYNYNNACKMINKIDQYKVGN